MAAMMTDCPTIKGLGVEVKETVAAGLTACVRMLELLLLSLPSPPTAMITNLPSSGGKASFSVPNLSVGTHLITGTYSGDGQNRGGTSAVLTQIVTDN